VKLNATEGAQKVNDQIVDQYNRDGYVVLEDAVAPDRLRAVQESYEETIEAAMDLGLAERNEDTGFLSQHRFQNPHHPRITRYPVMEALAAPAILDFVHAFCGDDATMQGIAAFAMNAEYDYRGPWHRDSYFAWGKDSAFERQIREMKTYPATQILFAVEDDASFWFVPGSHNRANTAEEEARFEEERTASDEMFAGALQLQVRAGSAVPFDARGIHRGLTPPGVRRRSLFVVYGSTESPKDAVISAWAQEPEYADPRYLASLPQAFRESVERTMEVLKG
jgi:ectoine hydroxylase-related dioxygenase (phytanoyl-CoA dioxygenase family)